MRIKGDKLRFIWIAFKAVTKKPSHDILEACLDQARQANMGGGGAENSPVIHKHVQATALPVGIDKLQEGRGIDSRQNGRKGGSLGGAVSEVD